MATGPIMMRTHWPWHFASTSSNRHLYPAIAVWIMLVATAWLALPKSWVTHENTAARDKHSVATMTSVSAPAAPARASREELLRRVAEDPLSVQAYKRIDEIREGDLVVARDDATGELVARPVTQLFRNTSDHLREVTYVTTNGDQHTVQTTDEHPFCPCESMPQLASWEVSPSFLRLPFGP